MIADGLLDRFPAARAFGLHNAPDLPLGSLGTAPGPFFAAEDNVEIVVTGRGGHAARPHLLADPLVGAAAMVGALQTVVSRAVPPDRYAVFSLTGFETDGARNVVPSRVRLTGDFRTYDDDTAILIARRIREIADHGAAMHGLTAKMSVSRSFEPLVNDTGAASTMAAAGGMAGLTVDDALPRLGVSEDFAWILARVPGAMAMLGQAGEGRHALPLHNPGYEFNDAAIPHGVALWRRLARMGGH